MINSSSNPGLLDVSLAVGVSGVPDPHNISWHDDGWQARGWSGGAPIAGRNASGYTRCSITKRRHIGGIKGGRREVYKNGAKGGYTIVLKGVYELVVKAVYTITAKKVYPMVMI